MKDYIASIGSVGNSDHKFIAKLFELPVVPIQPDERNIEDIEDAAFVVFWGGEDIATSLYDETPRWTDRMMPGVRDIFEMECFNFARAKEVPQLGICRGAQLLCALNGGKLWQHVHNHNVSHGVELFDGRRVTVTSTHHQMMRPTKEMKLIGWSMDVRSPRKGCELGETTTNEREAEIVFIPQSRALCIQGHPEYTPVDSAFSLLTRQLVKEYLK